MKIHQASSTLGSLLEKWTGEAGRTGTEDSTFKRFRSELTQAAQDPVTSSATGPSPSAILATFSQSSQTGTPVQDWSTTTEQTQSKTCAPNPDPSLNQKTAPVAPSTMEADTPVQEEPLEVTPSASWPVTFRDRAQWSLELGKAAKDAVKAELAKAGINPATVKISYWEEVCSYPGGSFILKNITVQAPNGDKCDFDAMLTLRSPWTTARDVMYMLRA